MKTKQYKIDPNKTPFDNALANMPMACFGNFDDLSHTTVEDLIYCADHEMDLYVEGEETDIQNEQQYDEVRRYRQWLAQGMPGHTMIKLRKAKRA